MNKKDREPTGFIPRGLGNITPKPASKTVDDPYMRHERSKGGTYELGFTKLYKNLTDKELDNVFEYALDLISQYMNIPKGWLHVESVAKKETLTLMSVDSVYYIKQGVRYVGKLSIRLTRTFSGVSVLYVFRKKQYTYTNNKVDHTLTKHEKDIQARRNRTRRITKKEID